LKNINQTPKKYMGMNMYSLLDFKKRKKITNFIFWNFEDQKEWKNRRKTKEMFRKKILKEKKNLLAFRKMEK
jgi:hypothetical protein